MTLLVKDCKGDTDRTSARTHTCVAQPFLQQGFEFAHVLEAQVERLEARDGGLTEIIAVQFTHGHTDIPLHEDTELL